MTEPLYTLADFADEVDIAHPLTAYRIPVLRSPYARWRYHVALVIGGPDFEPEANHGQEPTPREVDQLLVYLDKHLRYYHASYRRQVQGRGPFDVDGTVNTHIFRKHADLGWQYHAASWQQGPLWFPTPPWHPVGPLTLEELLDRIHTVGDGPPSRAWIDLKVESGAFDTLAPAASTTGAR